MGGARKGLRGQLPFHAFPLPLPRQLLPRKNFDGGKVPSGHYIMPRF